MTTMQTFAYDCTPYFVHLYKFTGKERDSESGLDYFGARYYGSALGRFTSPDWSANPEPVPYATLSNPQSLNLYSYVLNNPLSKPDLDGHVVGVDDLVEGAIVVAAGATIAFSAYLGQPQNQKSLTAAVTTAVNKIGSVFDSIVHSDKAPPNPNGAPGAPDHQEEVQKQLDKAQAAAQPGETVLGNQKIQGVDSTRRPDVQTVGADGKVSAGP